jgi:hypothetical protein
VSNPRGEAAREEIGANELVQYMNIRLAAAAGVLRPGGDGQKKFSGNLAFERISS